MELNQKYSAGFKQKVVSEYEKGQYSLNELQKRYGIGGHSTIVRWIVKMGRNELLGRKVMIMEANEVSEIEQLRERVKQLERVVSSQEIEVLALESLFEVAVETYGDEFKKNYLPQLPDEVRKKLEAL